MSSHRRGSSPLGVPSSFVVLALAMVIPTINGCAAGMSRLKTGLNGKPGIIAMPDLFRMSKARRSPP